MMVCPNCTGANGVHHRECRYRGTPYRIAVQSYFTIGSDDDAIAVEEWLKRYPDHERPAIHKKKDGYLLIYEDNRVRFLGWWEGIKHRFFGWTAQDFVDEETGAEVFRAVQ